MLCIFLGYIAISGFFTKRLETVDYIVLFLGICVGITLFLLLYQDSKHAAHSEDKNSLSAMSMTGYAMAALTILGSMSAFIKGLIGIIVALSLIGGFILLALWTIYSLFSDET